MSNLTIVEKIENTTEFVKELRNLLLQILVLVCVVKMVGTGLGLF